MWNKVGKAPELGYGYEAEETIGELKEMMTGLQGHFEEFWGKTRRDEPEPEVKAYARSLFFAGATAAMRLIIHVKHQSDPMAAGAEILAEIMRYAMEPPVDPPS